LTIEVVIVQFIYKLTKFLKLKFESEEPLKDFELLIFRKLL